MERNMITVETRYEHVILDENGVAIIAETKTKVIELVLDMMAYGWSPEELQFQPLFDPGTNPLSAGLLLGSSRITG